MRRFNLVVKSYKFIIKVGKLGKHPVCPRIGERKINQDYSLVLHFQQGKIEDAYQCYQWGNIDN